MLYIAKVSGGKDAGATSMITASIDAAIRAIRISYPKAKTIKVYEVLSVIEGVITMGDLVQTNKLK